MRNKHFALPNHPLDGSGRETVAEPALCPPEPSAGWFGDAMGRRGDAMGRRGDGRATAWEQTAARGENTELLSGSGASHRRHQIDAGSVFKLRLAVLSSGAKLVS